MLRRTHYRTNKTSTVFAFSTNRIGLQFTLEFEFDAPIPFFGLVISVLCFSAEFTYYLKGGLVDVDREDYA